MNNKLKKVLTTLVLILMILAIPVTLLVLSTDSFDFKINAFLNDKPTNVSVVDVRGSAVSIVWITEKAVVGLVKVEGSDLIFKDESSTSFHIVKITNLTPSKEYKFLLYSDGTEYASEEYSFRTADVIDTNEKPFIVYGQIFNKDGVSLQNEGLVLMTLTFNLNTSEELAAVINSSGGFSIDLSNIITSNGAQKFDYKKIVSLNIKVITDSVGTFVEKKFTINFGSQRQIPNIYLGDVNIDIMPGINGN